MRIWRRDLPMTKLFKEGDLVFLKADKNVQIEDRQMYEVVGVPYYYDEYRQSTIPVQKYSHKSRYWYHERVWVNEEDLEHVPDWLVVVDSLDNEPPQLDFSDYVSSSTMGVMFDAAKYGGVTFDETALALASLLNIPYREARRRLNAKVKKDKN